MMTKHTALAALGMTLFVSPALAQELAPLEPDITQLYASLLTENYAEVEDKQVEVDPDIEGAKGLALGMEGVIIVPTKGLNPESAIGDPEAQSETGAPLAIMFMSPRFNPLVDGKPVDEEKLRTITFTDGEGNEQKATMLLLAAKNVEGDDWRLNVFGSGKEPLVQSQFGGAEDIPDEEETVAIMVSEPEDDKATLTVRVFGLYTASFEIDHNVEDLF